MTEKVAEEEAKEPAIMPYNKDQKRPYKNPKVQFYKTGGGTTCGKNPTSPELRSRRRTEET